jgi:hypothetical protein
MVQQQYHRAAVKYQAALNEAPADIGTRFALATALSYLPRRAETVEQFRIIMQRATPGSPEARTARDWLAAAGELGEGAAAATAPGRPPVGGNQGPATGDARRGKVLGTLAWPGIEPRTRLVRVNISLTGDDVETRDVRLARDFMLGRVYEFRDLPPGAYHLVAQVAGTTMWDLKVEVPADTQTVLDLGESNSSAPAGFDPPAAD